MNITIEKIKADYNKKVHAYDFLLKKEIGYYEKVDCEYADLIVDIQDINYYIVKANRILDSIISRMFMYIMENMKRLSVLMVSYWQVPFQENSLRLLLAG